VREPTIAQALNEALREEMTRDHKENAIVGLAVGSALAGMRPVAEIMLSDFMTCGMDQTINYAAMSTYAGGGRIRLPLVIRTTTGHHGGPQHSNPWTLQPAMARTKANCAHEPA
jgi:pyruvate/2-oxoglutarate/acetoin dehydrogenase E1 component